MTHTSRLTLRPLVADDAAWITREIARPEVHCWITSPPRPYALADAETFIAHSADRPYYRVILHSDAPCGVVSITDGRQDKEAADIGYWLAKDAWGLGIMTEAATALLDRYFEDYPAVESGWIEGNTASQNVLTKLGFSKTGETRPIWSHFHGRDMPVTRVRLDRARWAEVSRERSVANADNSG